MSVISVCRFFLIAILVSSTCAIAEDLQPIPRRQQLENELAKVRGDLAAAQTNLDAQTKALWRQQHDTEYGDASITDLRKEIADLERQLVAKRKELNDRIEINPALKKVEEQRVALFRNIEDLKQNEKAIQNELRALENGQLPP